MESIKIKIGENEFIIKQSFRSLMMFEEMTGRNVNQLNDSLNDLMTLLYCMLKAANRMNFTYTYDEFIDLIDENPEIPVLFNDYLLSNSKPEEKKS